MPADQEVPAWVIAGKPEGTMPEVGKKYRICHQRKGVFEGVLNRIDGIWADFTITDGMAHAACEYNERYKGESVSCRDSLCVLKELPK